MQVPRPQPQHRTPSHLLTQYLRPLCLNSTAPLAPAYAQDPWPPTCTGILATASTQDTQLLPMQSRHSCVDPHLPTWGSLGHLQLGTLQPEFTTHRSLHLRTPHRVWRQLAATTLHGTGVFSEYAVMTCSYRLSQGGVYCMGRALVMAAVSKNGSGLGLDPRWDSPRPGLTQGVVEVFLGQILSSSIDLLVGQGGPRPILGLGSHRGQQRWSYARAWAP
ncbi:Hypothetical predicted protein, partial [Marmota monax]